MVLGCMKNEGRGGIRPARSSRPRYLCVSRECWVVVIAMPLGAENSRTRLVDMFLHFLSCGGPSQRVGLA